MKLINSLQTIIIGISLLIFAAWSFLPQNIINILWDVNWYSVFFVMLIRPLSQVFPKYKFLKKLVPLRKSMGILSAIIIVANFAYSTDWNLFPGAYFSAQAWGVENYRIFARLGEITAFILLITSNNWSIKTLKKWWKPIQRLAYVYFISGGIYLFSIGKTEVLWHMAIVGIFWVLAHFKIKLVK